MMARRNNVNESPDRKLPKIGVAVFILRDGKILMSERLKGNGAGTWGLAGGHLEMGETFEECCKREVKEETGLDINEVRLLTAVNKGIVASGDHYVTLFFVANNVDGTPLDLEPEKHGPWKWFPKNDIPKTCFEDFESLIKRYL